MGDVGHSIPRIYVVMSNRLVDHHELIIEKEVKLCDQVVSIFIHPRSSYSYPNLVDKCGLRR